MTSSRLLIYRIMQFVFTLALAYAISHAELLRNGELLGFESTGPLRQAPLHFGIPSPEAPDGAASAAAQN